mmetsp:Transcript_27384/g.35566  ORF Transcript_27384/g.35566 Transcript_27384/m.35566 type:complete len:416 (-) Transcript_27384:234-1481(-)
MDCIKDPVGNKQDINIGNSEDLKGIHDAIKNAAEVDQNQTIETWGPGAFCRRLRTKLHTTQLQIDPAHWRKPNAPRSLNILLLGPAGAGKSSLIYTWWRALSGSSFQDSSQAQELPNNRGAKKLPPKEGPWKEQEDKDSFFAHYAHHSLLQRLALGWTVDEARQNYQHVTGDNLAAMPRHGTSCFNAIHLTPVTDSSCGIAVHDTKGQSFFTPAEEKMAEALLKGKLLPGSTEEKKMYRYWFMVGSFGLFSVSNLSSCPHVVVLVFDITLRSFGNMLLDFEEGEENELNTLYKQVIQRATKQGQQSFVALTHVDKFEPNSEDDLFLDVDFNDYNRERDLQKIIDNIKDRLSAALSTETAGITQERIFAVENYRKEKYIQDPMLDLSVLEFLENVVVSANYYVSTEYKPPGLCSIS